MVRVIVGMMGSSVAGGSSKMAEVSQVEEFLSVVRSYEVRELDTARVYNGGRSEELLGQSRAESDFAISTKAPAFAPGSLEYQKIKNNCEKSLSALQQNKVDIYYLHGPDRQTPLEEQCRAIGELHVQGKFARFGVSNLRDGEVQEIYDICKREGYCLPSVYQGGFSPLHQKAKYTLLPLLQKLNMSFYAFSPLAGGLLAKPIDDILKPAKGSRFEAMPVFGDLFLNDTIIAALRTLTALCEKNGMSIMEATLRWFMHHSPLTETDGIILGASSTAQVDASLAATKKGPLPSEVAKGFEDMWMVIEKDAPGYCN
ncbi:aldehyde reductase [Phlyctema vagabunda]|uniref:Aldehyde reductase n=1 Tax=Phlyctema vagabunda TaxID=108571 RepID=A0ABR4P2L4_9HELO